MSTDCQFRTQSWTSSSSIQKWHFSHTCCTMEAKEEVRRVYLWELGFGFVSLHLPDLWELVAPEWFRPAQDSLSASLSISISEIVGLVSLWQIPQMEFSRFALEDQFWSCLFRIFDYKERTMIFVEHVLILIWCLSLSLYSSCINFNPDEIMKRERRDLFQNWFDQAQIINKGLHFQSLAWH